jgi:hypothetical protein
VVRKTSCGVAACRCTPVSWACVSNALPGAKRCHPGALPWENPAHSPLGVQANVLSCRHTRPPRLGVTLGDSGSVGHAFLLEWPYRHGG